MNVSENALENGLAPVFGVEPARKLSQYGIKPEDYLRKISVDGLMKDENGRLVPVADYGRDLEIDIKRQEEREFIQFVRGSMDAELLRRDYPDAVREISRIYGKNFFKRGGRGPDDIAKEMESFALLPQGSGADGLVERLKQGKKYYQSAADDSLSQDVAAWESTVDAFLDGSLDKRKPVTMLNQTPLVLTLMGADASKKVVTKYGTLRKVIVEKHHLPETIVKQVPAAMADPVMVFESATVKGDYVMMLDLKDENGASVVVPISLDYDGVGGYNVNYVPSMYAQKNTESNQPRNTWFLNQIEGGKLRYQNTKKSREWATSSGLQLPRVGSRPVNGKTKILTEADLVNLREQNPTLYQSKKDGPRGGLEIDDGFYLVHMFRGADLSTVLHESGHVFYREIKGIVEAGLADESLTKDYEALVSWSNEANDDATLEVFYNREYQSTPLYYGKPFDAMSAEEKADIRQLYRDEKFARGFEMYLREGKAPTKDLSSAFARFKKWLTRIYRQAFSLRVEITDEVRGVFDRLFATDVEIQSKAIELNLVDLGLKELEAMGIKGADRVFASGLMKAAHEAAAARMQEDRDKGRKEQLRTWQREAKEQVDKEPVYAMMAIMRNEPLDLDAIKALVGDDMATKARKRMPGGFKRDGLPPDVFAAYHGFDSVGDMLNAILSAPLKGVRVKEVIQDKQAAHDAQYKPEDYLIETDEALEQMAFVGKFLSENAGRGYADTEAVRRVAVNNMAAMPMSKVRSATQFRNYMAKALREERRAIAKGDFGAALSFNHQARLNMEMGRMALNIDRGITKLQDKIKAFAKSKLVGADAKYIVLDLASRYGFSRPPAALERGRDPMTIAAWEAEAKAEGFDVYLDDALLRGAGGNWREMTMEEFEGFADTLTSIMAVERNKNKLLTAESKATRDEAANEIAATNKNLLHEVAAGRFRSDLFYRLAVGIVRLPALRERGTDLDLLLEHALNQANEELGKYGDTVHKKFSDAAKNIMLSHSWPGNVRELKNTVMRAVLWSPAEIIDADSAKQALLVAADTDTSILGRPLGNGFSLNGLLDMVVVHYLKRATQESGGVKAKAANLLGIKNYQTLDNWLTKYGLK